MSIQGIVFGTISPNGDATGKKINNDDEDDGDIEDDETYTPSNRIESTPKYYT